MSKKISDKDESKKNLPAIFEYSIRDINYMVPQLFKGAAKKELTSIKNACDAGFGDKLGNIYIDAKYLDRVLRTKSFVAKEILINMNQSEKVSCEGHTFVKLGEVMRYITKRLETLSSGKTRNYLLLAEEFLKNIRDCEKFLNIRNEIQADYKAEITKLKNKRKRRLKSMGVKSFVDELTGDKLLRGAEFSHIRAKSVYPELSLNVENGLLVNKGTHELITSRMVVNESELLELCDEMNWAKDWHRVFKNLVV